MSPKNKLVSLRIAAVLLLAAIAIPCQFIRHEGQAYEGNLDTEYNNYLSRLEASVRSCWQRQNVCDPDVPPSDALQKALANAIASKDSNAVFACLRSAYPEMTREATRQIWDILQEGHADCEADRQELLSMVSKYQNWLSAQPGWLLTLGGGLPSDSLAINTGARVLHGQTALDYLQGTAP